MQNVNTFCMARGVKPTIACRDSGVGTSFLSDIKRGQTPSVAKVQLLATYLGVTTSELLGEQATTQNANDPGSANATEAALNEALIDRLCQLTPEELLRVDAFVQGMLGNRSGATSAPD